MATRPATFTQRDVTRACKAVRAAGEPVRRVEIDWRTGNIVLHIGEPSSAAPASGNDWDE